METMTGNNKSDGICPYSHASMDEDRANREAIIRCAVFIDTSPIMREKAQSVAALWAFEFSTQLLHSVHRKI